MTKIDWYILKKLLVTFIFCMFLFTVIAVAVDTSEKTDDFVKTGLSTAQIISQYYSGFVPFIWGMLFPLFVFIAVIFFTSRMAARSEIIAILANGVSYNRLMRPFIIGGTLLACVLWWANRFAIPRANVIRGTFQSTYFDKGDPSKNGGPVASYYLKSDSNSYVAIRYYDTVLKAASGFSLQRVKDNRIIYNLRAESMKWDTARKNWLLTNAIERNVDSMKETIRQLPVMHISLNIEPRDLRKDEYLKDKLSTPALKEFIRWQELRATEGLSTLKVEQFRRSATPATVLILTMIGAVISSRKNRGGSGIHLALGIVIAAMFILADRFSTVFAVKGNFPPVLAAWLPNLVFAVVGYWLYRKAPK